MGESGRLPSRRNGQAGLLAMVERVNAKMWEMVFDLWSTWEIEARRCTKSNNLVWELR
jgi:hypothetical protein